MEGKRLRSMYRYTKVYLSIERENGPNPECWRVYDRKRGIFSLRRLCREPV